MSYIAHKGKSRTSTVLPSFNAAGQRIERILPPGEKLGTGIDNGLGTDATTIATCACNSCKALYEQETAAP